MTRARFFALAAVLAALAGCNTLSAVLRDPVLDALLHDLRVLLSNLDELQQQPIATEEARVAVEEQRKATIDAAEAIIDRMRDEGFPEEADKQSRRLEERKGDAG